MSSALAYLAEEVLFVPEVVVDRVLRDPRFGGDRIHPGQVVPVPGEDRERGVQDRLPLVDPARRVLATMRRTASIESVAFSTVGQDLGGPAEGFTHAYLAAIPDLDALERYMHDPVHLKGDEFLLGQLAKLSAVRLSDDLDPELHQAIYAMHDRKVGMYPHWGRVRWRLSSAPPKRERPIYSAPSTSKFLLTKTWCGQLTAMMWTLYSPLLSSTTRLTVPPG